MHALFSMMNFVGWNYGVLPLDFKTLHVCSLFLLCKGSLWYDLFFRKSPPELNLIFESQCLHHADVFPVWWMLPGWRKSRVMFIFFSLWFFFCLSVSIEIDIFWWGHYYQQCECCDWWLCFISSWPIDPIDGSILFGHIYAATYPRKRLGKVHCSSCSEKLPCL